MKGFSMKTYKIYLHAFIILLFGATLYAQQQGTFFDDFRIHGFVSQGFLKSSANNFLAQTSNGTFQFNEIGVNVTYSALDNLRFGAQLLSRDLGNVGNNGVLIDWALVDYSWQDWLGIRAGKIKMPLGFYNEYRDLDLARTNIFLPPDFFTSSAIRCADNCPKCR